MKLCILCAGLMVCAGPPGLALPVHAQSDVPGMPAFGTGDIPFLTLRNRTDEDTPAQAYGEERGDLGAGWCTVRQWDLGGLTSLAEAAPSFIREEFLQVETIARADPGAVLEALQETAGDGGPAIYVHGYYIGFEKGCRRAALLRDNARLAGRFLWFSWPSDGSLASYTHDEADLYWSVPDIADAIFDLHQRFGDGAVDVLGHSLGARGVMLALYDLASRQPDIRLGEVVLLAPDMDFEIFERILPRITPIAEAVTVYTNSGDRPLALSAQVHGYPRLGEAGNDVATLTGAEVIDLSDMPAESPTGHLYHIYSQAVGDDLDQLLNERLRPPARRNLVRTGPNSWSMQPGDPADQP